jgi:hypothetical protein
VAGPAAICPGSPDQGVGAGGARNHSTGTDSAGILEASKQSDRPAYGGSRGRWLAITQLVKASRFS